MISITLVAATACNSPPKGKSYAVPIEGRWERTVASPTQPVPPPGHSTTAPSPDSAPAGRVEPAPAPEDVLAYVNGTPITRSAADAELVRSHGLGLLQQKILLIAARQRANQMGVRVTPADIKAAHEDALKRIASPVGASDELPLDRGSAEKLLNQFLVAKNISREEWERRMEQQAYLHKIATADLDKTTITEPMLREQYALEYGERVQVRHIQVASLEDEKRVRTALNSGKDFELVARQMSANPVSAARGGLMQPFTKSEPSVTPLLREAAFKLTVGETSPAIHEDNWYHIIKLERRFPASGVGFESVDRKTLESHLKERLIAAHVSDLEAELFKSANVDIRDKDLRTQFERSRSAGQ